MLKKYGEAMFGLLIVLVGLMVTLRLLGKLPVIGKVANTAKDLATDGSL